MIRKLQMSDREQVMRIWLSGNEQAHPFISKEYWRSNYDLVRQQLMQADVFGFETDGDVRGFVGLMDGYIAGIFVDAPYRSLGIGQQLLEYVKQTDGTLSLDVYEKNKRAVAFYVREGFSIQSEQLDEATGELEYTMVWKETHEMSSEWERLYAAAKNALNPRRISDYVEAGQVAAALMTTSGHIYTGICIDTACSLGMCAERNAIAHMLTCQESEIAKLAVVMADGAVAMPCGACCELMMQLGEWAKEIEILTDNQKMKSKRLKELFPNWWGKKGG